jgi:hypothetical protein
MDFMVFDGIEDAVSGRAVFDEFRGGEQVQGAGDGRQGAADETGQFLGVRGGLCECAKDLLAQGVAEGLVQAHGAKGRFFHGFTSFWFIKTSNPDQVVNGV